MLIPEELHTVKQWSFSHSSENLKRPFAAHTRYQPNGALTLQEALAKAGSDRYIGFYVTEEDPYVLIDADDVGGDPRSLPPKLAALLRTKRTYSEISPSGNGLRYILRLPSVSDKKEVNGKYFLGREEGYRAKDFQANFGPPWMTITQNVTKDSVSSVDEVTIEELSECFNVRRESKAEKVEVDSFAVPTKEEMFGALRSLPLDKNFRIQRAFKRVTGGNYAHYDYWLKVLMALHHYGTVADCGVECLHEVTQWSSTDEEAFTGDETVLKHWVSLDEKKTVTITYLTIFKLAAEYSLKWPVPKKGGGPVTSEYRNFEALMGYFDLHVYYCISDPNELYLTGDEDVILKHFGVPGTKRHFFHYFGPFDLKSLPNVLMPLAQEMGFSGVAVNKIKEFLLIFMTKSRQSVDFFRMYLDTPFDELPDEYKENEENRYVSTFDFLWSCIEVVDVPAESLALYRDYYKKWLFGLLRSVCYTGHHEANNCILLLTGPEQIRKTSHFRCLLPPALRNTIAFTTHGFSSEQSMRDIVKITSLHRIVVWDELEQYLNAESESNFKKVIDGLPQKFIDKYEVRADLFKPIAIYGATSNKNEFKLSGTGSRRIFHIPVKWVNTERMDTICWHPLLTGLRAEFDDLLGQGTVPWLLTEEQLEFQSALHVSLRSKNNIDLMLEHIWNFEQPFDNLEGIGSFQKDARRCLTLADVRSTLLKFGFPGDRVSITALKNSLERQCSSYTGTVRHPVELKKPRCVIRKGVAYQGPHTRYVMPPIRTAARIVNNFGA